MRTPFTTQTPAGFGGTLWRASRLKVALLLVVTAWVGGTALGTVAGGRTLDGPRVYLNAPDHTAGSAAALIRQHDCWTGAAPAGVGIPGHAVLSRAGGETTYAGPRLAGLALDQVFNHREHHLVVHAFCR